MNGEGKQIYREATHEALRETGKSILPYWMNLCARITPASQKGQKPEDPVNYLVVPMIHVAFSNLNIKWNMALV